MPTYWCYDCDEYAGCGDCDGCFEFSGGYVPVPGPRWEGPPRRWGRWALLAVVLIAGALLLAGGR